MTVFIKKIQTHRPFPDLDVVLKKTTAVRALSLVDETHCGPLKEAGLLTREWSNERNTACEKPEEAHSSRNVNPIYLEAAQRRLSEVPRQNWPPLQILFPQLVARPVMEDLKASVFSGAFLFCSLDNSELHQEYS